MLDVGHPPFGGAAPRTGSRCCSLHRIPVVPWDAAGGGGPGGAGALGAQRQQSGAGRAEPRRWARLMGGVGLEQESDGAGAAEEEHCFIQLAVCLAVL